MPLLAYRSGKARLWVALAPLMGIVVVVAVTAIPARTQAQVLCLQNLSYVSSATGPNEAMVRTGCEGNIVTVPHDPNMLLYEAAVAPDGHTIAMTLGFPTSPGFRELFVGDVSGGPATQVTFMNGSQVRPTWSPDSRTIGFYHSEDRTPAAEGAYVINLDTLILTRVAAGLKTVDSPGFSPDGTLLAISVGDPVQGSGIWAISTTQPATPFPVLKNISAGTPSFTPDSQYLVFSGGNATPDSQGLWTTDLFGHSFKLANSPLDDGTPTISNDWTAYFHAVRGTDTEEHIYSLWLGGTTVKAEVAGLGRQIEPTAFGGQVTARPASFPPGSSLPPTPTTSPTPPPPLSDFGVKDVSIIGSRSDRILTRKIGFVSNDNTPLVRYEYAWASTPTGSTPGPTLQRCAVALASCLLNYGPTSPSTTHNLLVRAVATGGKASPWLVKPVQIPKAFRLIVWGDSVAAGHHRDSEGAPTICQDETYSYGQTIWNRLQAQVPPQWRLEHGYVNVANSGFSTDRVMLGGVDACGNNHPAELPIIVKILGEDVGSWDWVVGTAGIDDTRNWPDVLGNIIKANLTGNIKTHQQCQTYVSQWQLLSNPAVGANLATNVGRISHEIEAANPLAHEEWTSYFNPADTGTLKLWVPKVCGGPFATALVAFHGSIRAGLGSSQFIWVDVDQALGMRDNLLQDIYPSDLALGKSGWPHPNQKGAKKIGELALKS